MFVIATAGTNKTLGQVDSVEESRPEEDQHVQIQSNIQEEEIDGSRPLGQVHHEEEG